MIDTGGSTESAAHKTARTAPFVREFANSPWTGYCATIGGVALTFVFLRLPQKNAGMTLLGCVSTVKERTVTGLPDVNTASLEDDIRQLIEKEFGLGKSKAPEAGLPAKNTAKQRLTRFEGISRPQLTPNW